MTGMKKYLKYKGVAINAFGLPISNSNKKDIKKFREIGKRYFQYKTFVFNFPLSAPKDQIVVCDIPGDKRKERDWFRRHLQKFDYIMLQKSVWVGPSPLPKDFLNYLKSIGVLSKLRTLKLAKPYSKEVNNL
jgi:DNA-binding transcriptional regulator PaaX